MPNAQLSDCSTFPICQSQEMNGNWGLCEAVKSLQKDPIDMHYSPRSCFALVLRKEREEEEVEAAQ